MDQPTARLAEAKVQRAVFGGGCFWCTEATFQRLKGISSVTSGYAGGEMENPGYESVSSGRSGHAEVIKVDFDPSIISYRDLLGVFFTVHDPTTLNQQGADKGTQYRSIILYASDEQKKQAKDYIKELTDNKVFNNPIVTELKPLEKFFAAEAYHKNYYNNNQNKPYCQIVINPKLKKLKERYAHLLKEA